MGMKIERVPINFLWTNKFLLFEFLFIKDFLYHYNLGLGSISWDWLSGKSCWIVISAHVNQQKYFSQKKKKVLEKRKWDVCKYQIQERIKSFAVF